MSFSPTRKTKAPLPVASNVIDLRVAQLIAMLQYRRPYRSDTEYEFRERFIAPLGPQELGENLYVRLPRPDGSHPRTLFSCHTDTVHRKGGKQAVIYDSDMGVIYKTDHKPLGADDAAGCWVMLQMIAHGVPGTYVFHTGEECGGVGSGWIADNEDAFLRQFDRAIAFDRRGTQNVITHQFGGRCCSEKFAQALSEALNVADDTFSYSPDDSGLFTDTANYTHVIPECTNLSVGYEGEHTGGEMLDVAHLQALAAAAVKMDWDALPTARDPRLYEPDDSWKGWSPRGLPKVWLKNLDVDPVPDEAQKRFDFETAEEEQLYHRYYHAMQRAEEFFGACLDARLDQAYHQITTDEVCDFYLESPHWFDVMLDSIQRHEVDDKDVMEWVKGY